MKQRLKELRNYYIICLKTDIDLFPTKIVNPRLPVAREISTFLEKCLQLPGPKPRNQKFSFVAGINAAFPYFQLMK